MFQVRVRLLLAIALSLGFHAGLLALRMVQAPPHRVSAFEEPLQATLMIASRQERKPASKQGAVRTEHLASGSVGHSTKPRLAIPAAPGVEEKERPRVTDPASPTLTPGEKPATLPAPSAPSAEEWKLASTYTLKNSKRYRYNWGQQVRSMMGTSVAGVREGLVRFHIEIGPDGKLAKAEVLWSTSEIAEKLALQAIRSLPPLPPTPTGKPLVFEKTIAFVPFETGWPPVYKYDCLPDPPSFHNPFAWDASSPRHTSQAAQEGASPSRSATQQAECPGSEPDSIEAEEKDMERQFKEWGSGRLNGVD